MSGLCGNPDCGAFPDVPFVPCRDRETKQVVLLCQGCVRAIRPFGRYTTMDLEPLREEQNERK